MLKLSEEFQELIKDEKELNFATEYIFSELIDEVILNIALETTYKSKIANNLEEEEKEDDASIEKEVAKAKTSYNKKNDMVFCQCSNCGRKNVAVEKFASHLQNCMNIGRSSTRSLRKRKYT